MNTLQAISLTDVRNINRDSLLRTMFILPWLLALLLRWAIPWLAAGTVAIFDVRPYFGMLTSFFSIMLVPQLFGYVIGFLLLDERDDGTLVALRVTPLSTYRFLALRLVAPMIMSVLAVYLFVLLVDLVRVPLGPLLPIALLGALEGPLFALLLAALAGNKVQGLAVMKGLSLLFVAPAVAYFVAEPWQWLFGLAPTYWPVKAFWQASAGATWWPYVVIGFIVHGLVIWLLVRRFERTLAS